MNESQMRAVMASTLAMVRARLFRKKQSGVTIEEIIVHQVIRDIEDEYQLNETAK